MKNLVNSTTQKSNSIRKFIFLSAVIVCLSSFISPPIALTLGILIAQFVGHPFHENNRKWISWLLQFSVVGLGFGLSVTTALKAGKDGVIFTIVSIFGMLILGYIVGKVLKVDKITSFLISIGTAICGGSAIAAITPIIQPKENQISVGLGIVFILNSLALFIFPFVGEQLHMSQADFGLWCAIAIHDTSSVVGAASKFGDEALQIATTVKLARALWIVPIAFVCTFVFKSKDKKIKIPYFIGLFVLAIIANTYIPFFQKINTYILSVSKVGLTLTLFLIGTGLSSRTLKSVGFKPLLQGIILWIVISVSSILVILNR